MAAILVDYENVGNANGLRGVDVLQETDTLVFLQWLLWQDTLLLYAGNKVQWMQIQSGEVKGSRKECS